MAQLSKDFPFIPKFQQEPLRSAQHIPATLDSRCASKAAFQHSQGRQQLRTLKCYDKHHSYSDIVSVTYFSQSVF